MKNSLILDSYSSPVLCGIVADKPTTLSQAMHNAGFKAAGLPFAYIAIDTKNTNEAIERAKALRMRGLSLTIPHKEQALDYLDHISDEAQEIAAVNTIIFDENGLTGENTDWLGIVDAFSEASANVKDKAALIFGAGGAARAAVYALKQMGSSKIAVVNRTDERAKKMAESCSVEFLQLKDLNENVVSEFEILINSTPIGSKLDPNGKYSFDLNCINESQIIFDMVTNPTNLTKTGRSKNAITIEGSRMLLFQALEQFRLFTCKEPMRDAMEQALASELCRK